MICCLLESGKELGESDTWCVVGQEGTRERLKSVIFYHRLSAKPLPYQCSRFTVREDSVFAYSFE